MEANNIQQAGATYQTTMIQENRIRNNESTEVVVAYPVVVATAVPCASSN